MNKYKINNCTIDEPSIRSSLENYFGNFSNIIDSNESFNSVCKNIVACLTNPGTRIIREEESNYLKLSDQIIGLKDQTIKTSWGGVVLKEIELPRIQKYLVINEGKYLALEKHALKEETILVEEGTGILLIEAKTEGVLDAIYMEKGFKTFFPPGKIHCVIALENLVIFEDSLDHKGMDNDLIFIFEPS